MLFRAPANRWRVMRGQSVSNSSSDNVMCSGRGIRNLMAWIRSNVRYKIPNYEINRTFEIGVWFMESRVCSAEYPRLVSPSRGWKSLNIWEKL